MALQTVYIIRAADEWWGAPRDEWYSRRICTERLLVVVAPTTAWITYRKNLKLAEAIQHRSTSGKYPCSIEQNTNMLRIVGKPPSRSDRKPVHDNAISKRTDYGAVAHRNGIKQAVLSILCKWADVRWPHYCRFIEFYDRALHVGYIKTVHCEELFICMGSVEGQRSDFIPTQGTNLEHSW